MKIYLQSNVLEAAKNRIRFLFREFPNVVVAVSGGKDSTVVFNLTLEVAREEKRLPLRVLFIDQEAEWQATIDNVRSQMEHPDVEPYWLQVPFRLFNATSFSEHWLHCWDPAKRDVWVRPQESYSIKENNFGTDRFAKLFPATAKVLFKGQRTAYIGGIRCEESPTRFVAFTHMPKYKWVTWAASNGHGNFTFYPIYDWSVYDVWKAIHQHGWKYNRVYDNHYRYGIKLRDMRVSSLHHETSIWALFMLQEIEPETYHRLVARIQGIDTAGKMGIDDYFQQDLPPMFGDWKEYRDYLLEKLVDNPEWKKKFKANFDRQDSCYGGRGSATDEEMWRVHVGALLRNDWEGVKIVNYDNTPERFEIMRDIRMRKKKMEELASQNNLPASLEEYENQK